MVRRQFLTAASALIGIVVFTAPACAIDLTGVWATDASRCGQIFKKTGSEVTFTQSSDQYGNGFIVEDDHIRGKTARCTIKSRKEEGATVHLLATCSTDIMLSSVQFSLKVLDDNSISRFFPGMPGLDTTYYRCTL